MLRKLTSSLEQATIILLVPFIVEHTLSCSCGRFFEQHPTSIDDTVNENLERMLRQIRTGLCRCLQNNPDPDTNDARTQRNPRIAKKSLLHGAVAAGHLNIAQFLLAHGCSVNKVSKVSHHIVLAKIFSCFHIYISLKHSRIKGRQTCFNQKTKKAVLKVAVLQLLSTVICCV